MEFELECKVEIATNCDSGELSLESSKLQDKIIVELTTGGRIPVNPQTISCTDIPIPTSASGWIGFQVIKTGLIPQNIFEIKVVPIDPTTTKIQIKRVYENNVVYASDNQNFVPPPTLQVDNPFKMILRTLNNDLDIGKISVTKNTTTVNLCQFISDPPWNNAFNFIVMKSTIPNGMIAPSVFENTTNLQSPQFSDKPGFVNAQSPFCETLRVFFSEQSNYISQNATIRLLNSNGQIVMEEQIVPSFGQLSLPAQSIAPGIYFLQLEYEDETQTLKVVKIE